MRANHASIEQALAYAPYMVCVDGVWQPPPEAYAQERALAMLQGVPYDQPLTLYRDGFEPPRNAVMAPSQSELFRLCKDAVDLGGMYNGQRTHTGAERAALHEGLHTQYATDGLGSRDYRPGIMLFRYPPDHPLGQERQDGSRQFEWLPFSGGTVTATKAGLAGLKACPPVPDRGDRIGYTALGFDKRDQIERAVAKLGLKPLERAPSPTRAWTEGRKPLPHSLAGPLGGLAAGATKLGSGLKSGGSSKPGGGSGSVARGRTAEDGIGLTRNPRSAATSGSTGRPSIRIGGTPSGGSAPGRTSGSRPSPTSRTVPTGSSPSRPSATAGGSSSPSRPATGKPVSLNRGKPKIHRPGRKKTGTPEGTTTTERTVVTRFVSLLKQTIKPPETGRDRKPAQAKGLHNIKTSEKDHFEVTDTIGYTAMVLRNVGEGYIPAATINIENRIAAINSRIIGLYSTINDDNRGIVMAQINLLESAIQCLRAAEADLGSGGGGARYAMAAYRELI